MVAAASWELVGGDPTRGDPLAYTQLSETLERTAKNAESAHKRLSDLKESVDDSIWKGQAAIAFKEQIGKLPGDLEKLFNSYQVAADAMAEYGRTLTCLKKEAEGLVCAAETAQGEETAHCQARDQALATEPMTPTAPYDDAVEAARCKIREATSSIASIRERRQGAENKAVDGLGHAGDIGVQNKKWYQKALAALADGAEFVAFALAVIAIVVVVVILLTNPAGWAALGTALSAAAGLFTASTIASGVALTVKLGGKAAGNQDVTWREIAGDGGWLTLNVVGGQVLKPISALKVRALSPQFVSQASQSRRVLGVITSGGEALLLNNRATINVVRATSTTAWKIPLQLDGVFNVAWALNKDIPTYTGDHPLPPHPRPALGIALGRSVSCTAIHTPIPAGAGR